MDDSPRIEVGHLIHSREYREWSFGVSVAVLAYGLGLFAALASPLAALADPARFWISSSNVSPSGPEAPTIVGVNGSTRYLHIWAQPAPGKTLQNFSLNLVTTQPVVRFDDESIIVHNPLLDGAKRFHFVNDSSEELSSEVDTPGMPDVIKGIQGFNVSDTLPYTFGDVTYTGIGGASCHPNDPYCDDNGPNGPAWLLASVAAETIATSGSTDYFLRIGSNGMSHAGDLNGSAGTSVIFGTGTGPIYNASTDREISHPGETSDFVMQAAASATPMQWSGGSGEWSDGARWDNSTAPSWSNNVFLGAGLGENAVTVTGSQRANTTTVNGGRLHISAGGSLASDVVVGSGGTLSGGGWVGSDLTLSGNLAIASDQPLRVAGAVTMAGGTIALSDSYTQAPNTTVSLVVLESVGGGINGGTFMMPTDPQLRPGYFLESITRLSHSITVQLRTDAVDLPGDFNSDGTVNAADYVMWRKNGGTAGERATWQEHYGETSIVASLNPPGDYNGDSKVDAGDYVMWRKIDGTQAAYNTWRTNFGRTTAGGFRSFNNNTIPEPAGIMLALVGVCLLRASSRTPRTSTSCTAADRERPALLCLTCWPTIVDLRNGFALSRPWIVAWQNGSVAPDSAQLETSTTTYWTRNKHFAYRFVFTLGLSANFSAAVLGQGDKYWDRGGENNLWTNEANWSFGGIDPPPGDFPGINDRAIFYLPGSVGTSQVIDLNGQQSAKGVVFHNPQPVSIQPSHPSHSLALGVDGIEVMPGANSSEITSSVTLNTSQTWTNNSNSILTVSGNITMGTSLLNVFGTSNTTISGVLGNGGTPSGGLFMSGSGVLRLTGANNYTAGTTINQGTVVFVPGSLPLVGNIAANNGTVLMLESPGGGIFNYGTFSQQATLNNSGIEFRNTGVTAAENAFFGNIVLNGSVEVATSGPQLVGRLSGAVVGTGDLFVNGVVRLSNNNTFTGETRLVVGQLRIGHSNALSKSTLHMHQDDLGILTFDSGIISASVGGLRGTRNIVLQNTSIVPEPVALTIGKNNVTTEYSGELSGSGSLTKVGSGAVTLSGANTYSGGTAINGGSIFFDDETNFGLGDISFDGGSLFATAGAQGSSVSLNKAITLNAGGGTFNTNTHTLNLDGAISGVGALTKSGVGALNLYGNNTYNGGTVINQGSIYFAADANFGTSGITIDGGSLFATAGAQGSSVSLNKAITLNAGGGTFNTNTHTLNLDGAISGVGALTKSGVGALNLYGNNTYNGGTVINQGSIYFAEDANFGTNRITFDGGGLVATAGEFGANVILSKNITLKSGGGAVNTNTHTLTLSGAISGVGALAKSGAGTLVLTNSNPYFGDTRIDAGQLLLKHDQAIEKSTLDYNNYGGSIQFGTPAVYTLGGLKGSQNLALTNSSAAAVALTVGNNDASTTYSGVLSGSGASLTKIGTGTLQLSGSNTYTGGTEVNAGKLAVNGSIIGQVTVNSGGAFGGDGTVHGSVGNDGRVAPGNSPGILTIDGDYTQTNDGTLEIEFGGLTPGPTGHDQLVVTGTATLDGRLEVPIVDLGNGYIPSPDQDEITFLTAATRFGSFRKPVAPNLTQFNQTHGTNLAFQAVYGPTSVKLRVVERSDGVVEFDSVIDEANWSDAATFTTGDQPDDRHIIEIENFYDDGPQTVKVNVQEAAVHRLTVADEEDAITLLIEADKILTSQTEVIVGSHGSIILESNSILNGGNITVSNGALLGGKGTVFANEVTVGGAGAEAILSPGSSPGTLTIAGNYRQQAGGTLLVELESEVSHDKVDITGSAQLGGTLIFDASMLSAADVGSRVEILTAGTLTGRFDRVDTIGSKYYIRPIYNDGVAGAGATMDGVVCGSPGDMDCDGIVVDDDGDIPIFAMALRDVDRFLNDPEYAEYGGTISGADVDGCQLDSYVECGNDRLDFDDIDDFVRLHSGGGSVAATFGKLLAAVESYESVPEPASSILVLTSACVLMCSQQRTRGSDIFSMDGVGRC